MSEFHYIIFDIATGQPLSFRCETPKAAWADAAHRAGKIKRIRKGGKSVYGLAKIPANAKLSECTPLNNYKV